MFNEGFYPTPDRVIDMMVKPYTTERFRLATRYILEPSAGKGNILDRLKTMHNADPKRLYACEIEPELRMILTGKNYPVIEHDFLRYSDRTRIDLVVMNPPFRDGAKHLLKAWEVLPAGDIVCLLNRETLDNAYTDERKLVNRLIDMFGSKEEIGQAFTDAERKTAVECVIVRLNKPPKEESNPFDEAHGFEFDSPVQEETFASNPLAHTNILETLVMQYNMAAAALVERHKYDQRYAFYIKGIVKSSYKEVDPQKEATTEALNDKLTGLKMQFWNYVFEKTKLGQVMTSNFREDFQKFTLETSRLAFSEDNIRSVLQMFFENRGEIMQRCIVEVFDKATKYHEKNVVHTEGWKTNKSWKIAKKIIMPYGVRNDYSWSTPYDHRKDFYNDMDKALCFITGRKYEDQYQKDATFVAIMRAMEDRCKLINNREVDYDAPFDSEYFTIRMYKKGTVHLTFRDLTLLAKFNQAAAKGKNWVGDGS